MNISLREYSLLINKHNQKLINILENQKIFWFSNMLISFWLCLFISKLYSRKDMFILYFLFYHR